MGPTDMIDRELKVDDFVVFSNNIYQIKSLAKVDKRNKGYVKILLINPSKTTRPVNKHSSDLCKLDSGEVMFWMLKKD